MASVFWKKVGDNFINQAGPGPMFLLGITPDPGGTTTNWFIWGSPTGNSDDRFVDISSPFANQAAAITALTNYVAQLNAGTATG